MERVGFQPDGEPSVQWVLVFGVGLIGETLLAELSRRGFYVAVRLSFSWQPDLDKTRADEMDAICMWLHARVSAQSNAGMNANRMSIDTVWSAGRGGFSSTWAALDEELGAFRAVTCLSTRLLDTLPLAAHRFHLTSSAGGLYEGQRNVGAKTVPAPQRPYGELKLEQEKQLHATSGALFKRIYRPSSVYGFLSLNGRQGLISTLINNGMRGQVTKIFAAAQTLRDYVLVDDVAAFIAQKIDHGAAELQATYLLASVKPTSVHEVLVLLERILDRPLYFVFRPTDENTASNTFSPRAVAEEFRPQDLERGMRSVLLAMRYQFCKHIRRGWPT